MNIFFMGTGAAEGIPALFCECDICTEAKRRGGPDRRTRTSVLIDGQVKIDLPPDALAHVHHYPQINMARLQHILFTHSHDDHFAIRELQYLSPNFAPYRSEPLHVWATHQVIKKMLPDMAHFFEEAPLRFHPLVPFNEFTVANLRVTPVTAHHRSDEICLNFVIRDRERTKTLLYASDTGWYDAPTWEFLDSTQLNGVVLECGKGVSRSTYDGHLSIDDVLRVRDRMAKILQPNALFYVTHIAHTGLLLHQQMVERLAPHGISVAYDGLEVRLP